MRRILSFMVSVAIACSASTTTLAAMGVGQSEPANTSDITPLVAKVAEMAKTIGMKTLLCGEVDDARANPIVGVGMYAQPPGSTHLIQYNGDQMGAFMRAVADEAKTGGWRQILIVVDNGAVTVRRRPSPGPIEGFNARCDAELADIFPGFTKN
jgi:hypothetical protein